MVGVTDQSIGATGAGPADFPRYVSAQLHCHSSIEGPASIGAHCYEAARAGVEVVWLTDHDTRIALCIGGPFLDCFDFESPALTTSVDRVASGGRAVQRNVGWYVRRQDEQLAHARAVLSKERCYRGTQSLCVEAAAAAADDDWRYFSLEFKAEAKIHSRPLMAEPTVGAAVFPADFSTSTDGGEATAEAWLDLVLSEQPPDLRQGRLRYLLTSGAGQHGTSEHAPEHEDRYCTHLVPLASAAGTWTRHEMRPAEDAETGDLGGIDNALVGLRLGVRVRRGGRLRLFLDDLTIAHRCAGDELHARQRVLARSLGQRYGVTCHVAQEISLAGQHKNAWGSAVPLLDYAAQPSGFTHEHGVDWARRHGGVFSLNHPFSKYTRVELDSLARERALEDLLETYVGTGASGADTLEVGFPAGRHGFDLDYYLRLWDGLSRQGVIVTGSGSSDAHSARVGWQTGNNFATHIRSDSTLDSSSDSTSDSTSDSSSDSTSTSDSISDSSSDSTSTSDSISDSTQEDALITGLRSGDVYMADPILFRSRLRYGDRAGHRMGQVVGQAAGHGDGHRATEPKAEIEADVDAGVEREIETETDTEREMNAEGEAEVEITLDRSKSTWRLYWVVNGERRPGIALREGAVAERLTVPLGAPVFVRAEVWDSACTAAGPPVEKGPSSTIESARMESVAMESARMESATSAGAGGPGAGEGSTAGPAAGAGTAGRGRCIALTNPIWYVPEPALAAVPAERRA